MANGSERRLIIDGQVLQTEARHRGMGRYSVHLIAAVLRQAAYGQVSMIFTRALPLSKRDKAELQALLPGVDFHYLSLKTTTQAPIEEALTHNRAVVSRFVAGLAGNGVVDYLIPSPFQEPAVSVFPEGVKKVLLFYDLIPYLYHERYKPVMQYDNYLKRFRLLFDADAICTISQSVADDLRIYIGLPAERLVCIDGAPIKADRAGAKPRDLEIPEHFILMPTSDDLRKNNRQAVLGFETFCAQQPDMDYKLVVTSTIHPQERERLRRLSRRLVFTGNLPEAELDWLYEQCEAVLFVPESEGLGLPVLEAATAGKKVICSTLSVFKEISEDAFYYCDHEDGQSIANALHEALNDNKSIPKKEYNRVLRHYSWPATAERFISGTRAIASRPVRQKPKLAMFTPAPEGLSAIGKVVAESHAVMSEYFDIDYYTERGLYGQAVRPNYLQYVANYAPAETFSVEEYSQYDAVVYHIGNGDYHLESIKNGLYLPGYAIIHDTNIKEAYRVLKEQGMIHESRVALEELLNNTVTDRMSSYLTSLLNNQLGVLTHSDFARKAAQQIVPKGVPVRAVNLPSATAALPNYRGRRQMVIGLAGIIADVKGIAVIESIAGDPAFKNCNIRLFGFSHASRETINRLKMYENVSVATNLTDFDFQTSIAKLDVFVNYRLEYKGETSLSTIEAMRQGVVVFVRDIGWYAELPDNAVVKVQSPKEVLAKLKPLLNDSRTLESTSWAAKQYIATHHSHQQYAKGLSELLRFTPNKSRSALVAELKALHIHSGRQYLQALERLEEGSI